MPAGSTVAAKAAVFGSTVLCGNSVWANPVPFGLVQSSGGGLPLLPAPKPTVNEMMYQETCTSPPIFGPQTFKLAPSSTLKVLVTNNRSTRYDAPRLT